MNKEAGNEKDGWNFRARLEKTRNAILGKGVNSRWSDSILYENKHETNTATEISLEVIVNDLSEIPDTDWVGYAFSSEPLKGKFDSKARLQLMLHAAECGETAAKDCASQYGTGDPEKLAEKMGLAIEYIGAEESPAGLISGNLIFARFCTPNRITIFTDCIDRAKSCLVKCGLETQFPVNKIQNILLAHEIFHFVEEQRKKEIWSETHRITLWSLGPLRYRSPVAVLGEIAAMAFCKKLSAVEFSPYCLDAVLTYAYSPQLAGNIYRQIMNLSGRQIHKE